jgi:phosphoenolpyruvate-protein phosphotransferase (PTS system enzyme I)
VNNCEESLNHRIKQNDFLLKGIGVSPGIIIGKSFLFDTNEIEVPAFPLNTEAAISQEIKKLKQALIQSKQQLLKLK